RRRIVISLGGSAASVLIVCDPRLQSAASIEPASSLPIFRSDRISAWTASGERGRGKFRTPHCTRKGLRLELQRVARRPPLFPPPPRRLLYSPLFPPPAGV